MKKTIALIIGLAALASVTLTTGNAATATYAANGVTPGQSNILASAVTNVYPGAITATNSPVNGWALRYTNGNLYWAP